MLILPAPNPLDGRLLAEQLTAVGLVTTPREIRVDGASLMLAHLVEANRAAALTVLDAHPVTAEAEATRFAGEQVNAATIRQQAETALANNRAFLASPIPATVAARLARLEQEADRAARQRNGLIRLVLNRFDGTD